MRKVRKNRAGRLRKQQNSGLDKNGGDGAMRQAGKEERKKGKIFFLQKRYRLKKNRKAGKRDKKSNQNQISSGGSLNASGSYLQKSGRQ